MNLIKERQKKTMIDRIIIDGIQYQSHTMIEKISNYYSDLYSRGEVEDYGNYLDSVQQTLNESDANNMEQEITLEEAKITLDTCKDSCPGIDDICYSFYKVFWSLLGPLLVSSWNWSVSTGTLSSDQKHSIITLLQKPGKPIGYINNLRPISLSNCDCKIMTKALTNRITKLGYLFSPMQAAYIKGRNIVDNIRYINNVVDYCNELDIEAYILSLDASKAFDSIDHEFMLETLKRLGFKEKFIGIIRMLYNGLTAQVMINGVRSNIFRINRGVKQGDALSCVLFILCMEVLLKKIDNNCRIKPIEIPDPFTGSSTRQKYTIFADDFTPIVRDQSSITEVFYEYSMFSKYSGIKLNTDKTEILRLGDKRVPMNVVVQGVELASKTKDNIKVCGIYFGEDRAELYKLNVLSRINSFTGILQRMKSRKLLIEGNITIIKTLALSQLIYVMQSCHIKLSDLIRVERMIFEFIWRGRDRVKREVLKLGKFEGGMQAPDTIKINMAIKAKMFYRNTYHNKQHPVSLTWGNRLWKHGFRTHGELTVISEKQFRKELENEAVAFEKACIITHRYMNNVFFDSLNNLSKEDMLVSSEYKTRLAAASLDSFTNSDTHIHARTLYKKGICNVVQLLLKKSDPDRMLEKLSILNQIPVKLRALLIGKENKYNKEAELYQYNKICIGENRWLDFKLINSNILQKVFSNTKVNLTDSLAKIEVNIASEEDAWRIYRLAYKSTIDIRLKDFQYKLIMNILNTRSKLFTFGHADMIETHLNLKLISFQHG